MAVGQRPTFALRGSAREVRRQQAGGVLVEYASNCAETHGMHQNRGVEQSMNTLRKMALLPMLLVSLLTGCSQGGSFLYTCAESEKIQAAKRSSIQKTALRFVEAAVAEDPETAYGLFTPDAQREVSREGLAASFKLTAQQFGPIKDLRVSETYLISATGSMPPQGVVCGSDLSRPEGWVAVAAQSVAEQAHVLVEGRGKAESWVGALWLVPEQKQWRVQYFQGGLSTVLGKRAEYYWSQARKQATKGNIRNSAVLYSAAASLAFRGPMFQPGIHSEILQEMHQLNLPEDLRGQPPFVWREGRTEFRVLRVNALAVAGQLYLLIAHEVEPWTDEKEVDRRNRQLMRYVVDSFPEYPDVFGGLAIEGAEPTGNYLYRTIEPYDKLRPKQSTPRGKGS